MGRILPQFSFNFYHDGCGWGSHFSLIGSTQFLQKRLTIPEWGDCMMAAFRTKEYRMPNKKIIYKIITDVTVAAGTVALLSEHATGTTIHEWLGVAGAVALLTHLLLSFDWFAAVTKRFFQKQTWQVRANWLVSTALFVAMTAVMYSGMMISKVVLPTLGIELAGGFSWRSIHELSSNLILVLAGLHLAVNWKWVVKYILGPFRRQPRRVESPAISAPVGQAR